MLLDDHSSQAGDLQLHSIAHRVITLHQLAIDYGKERGRLRVKKMRGIKFRGGYHELLSYLNQLGVLTIMVLAQHGMLGQMQTPIDLSYLSDAVIMLRYFEAAGRVRRASQR